MMVPKETALIFGGISDWYLDKIVYKEPVKIIGVMTESYKIYVFVIRITCLIAWYQGPFYIPSSKLDVFGTVERLFFELKVI